MQLVTVDIENIFDSINPSFLLCVLKKVEFGCEFMKWIKILLKNPESCFINDGKTTPYFKLEREIGQGDPISASLFILALEVVLALINVNPNIEGLQFFSHNFFYSAYAHDTIFLKKTKNQLLNYKYI